MNWSTLLSAGGSFAGIVAVLYVAVVGQVPLVEWLRSRRNVTPARRIIHNLPQPLHHGLVDRVQELQCLVEQLTTASAHAVVAVVGFGGVGKTTLALEAAHQLFSRAGHRRPNQYDTFIWCSAQQYELLPSGIVQRRSAVQSIADVFRAIAITLERREILQAPLAEREHLVRTLLSQRRVLLIVDNIETIEADTILSFLRTMPSPTRALVTTRPELGWAYEIRLAEFGPTDTAALVAHELAAKGLDSSAELEAQVYDCSGGVALAAVWSAGQIAYGFDLEALREAVSNPDGDVVEYIFSNAIVRIRGTDGYRLIMAISLFPTDVARSMAFRVADLDDAAGSAAARDLLKLSLVRVSDDRFSILPLAHQFMAGEVSADPSLSAELKSRMTDLLLDFVASGLGTDYWAPITRWLTNVQIERDIKAILQCVRWAVGDRNHDVVLRLGGVLVHHLWRIGMIDERKTVSEWCIAAAHELGLVEWEAWLLIDGVGYILLTRRDDERALELLTRGRALAVSNGLADGEALAIAYLVQLAIGRDVDSDYSSDLGRAQALATLPPVRARVRAVQAYVAVAKRDWRDAAEMYRDVVDLRRASDGYDPPTQLALYGLMLALAGQLDEARPILARSRNHPRQTLEGRAYSGFGCAHLARNAGRPRRASRLTSEALADLRAMGTKGLEPEFEAFLADLRPWHPRNIVRFVRSARHLNR